jgi:PIN domain nuclease of toxin-antitoxin system
MTALLLDTQAMLWFLRDDPRLSKDAKLAIEDASRRKFVSIASCWEIAIKVGLGKLQLGEATGTLLQREFTRNCFEVLGITIDHVAIVETLPQHHRDPFDRLLVAQATFERLQFVSSDAVFDQYGVARVW